MAAPTILLTTATVRRDNPWSLKGGDMTAPEAETKLTEPESDETRERSTIGFPYNDLDQAIRVANAIYRVGGSSLTREQLAADLKVSSTGGGFSLLTQTAKTFGFVTYGQGTIQLTELGRQINDPKREKVAKSTAFLTVPLYKAIYEKYKTGAIPPATALENEMAGLGVAKKQTDKARQVFQRSAQQAGFFAHGTDRLILPAIGPVTPEPKRDDPAPDPDASAKKTPDDGGNGGGRHPFIQGLLKELPNEGQEWPTANRVKWLKAATMIFDLIYTNEDTGKPMKIEVSTDSAK
jgi:hypothetical protein